MGRLSFELLRQMFGSFLNAFTSLADGPSANDVTVNLDRSTVTNWVRAIGVKFADPDRVNHVECEIERCFSLLCQRARDHGFRRWFESRSVGQS